MRIKSAIIGGAFTAFLLLPIWASSQTPSNDTCAGAVDLTNGAPYVMSTTNATSAGDNPQCWAGFTKGVWFNYTPSVNGLVIVTTCASDFPTFVTVNAN